MADDDDGGNGQIWLVGCSCVGVLGLALVGVVAVGVSWYLQPPEPPEPDEPVAAQETGAPAPPTEDAGPTLSPWLVQVQAGETCSLEYLGGGEPPVPIHSLPGACPGWGYPHGLYAPDRGRALIRLPGDGVLLFDLAGSRTRLVSHPAKEAVVRFWFDPAGELHASGTLDVQPREEAGEIAWSFGGERYARLPPQSPHRHPFLCQRWSEVGGAWLPVEVLPWDDAGMPVPCYSAAEKHGEEPAEDWDAHDAEDVLELADDYADMEYPDPAPLPVLDAALLPGADPARSHVIIEGGGTRYAFASDPMKGPGLTPLWFEAAPGRWETVEGFGASDALLDAGSFGDEVAACIDGKAALLVAGHARWSGTVCPLPWPLPPPAPIAVPYGPSVPTPGYGGPGAWWVAEPVAAGCLLARWSDGVRTDLRTLDTRCTPPQVARTDAGMWVAVGGRMVLDGVAHGAAAGTLSLLRDGAGGVWALEEGPGGEVGGAEPGGDVACVVHRVTTEVVAEAPIPGPCAVVAAARALTLVVPEPPPVEGARWSWRDVVTAAADAGRVRAPIEVDGEALGAFAPDGAPLTVTERGDALLVCGPEGAILVDGARRRVVAAFAVCPSPAEGG